MLKPRKLLLILLNVLAILLCGLAGGLAGFALMRGVGIDGIPGALLAALVAMVVASLTWAFGAIIVKTLRLTR